MSNFINFSNHPSGAWSKAQMGAAEKYGNVVDVPFPNVSPYLSADEVKKLGDECISKIVDQSPAAVMCQGESTLTFYVAKGLQKHNIKVLAACSDRSVTEERDASGKVTRVSVFKFVQFREYK